MLASDKTSDHLSQSGQNLVRIVIASYFLAVSLGLIPGTAAWPLTAPFLPAPYADLAGKAIIFTTAYLVLVGAWLRVSALLLATVLFWSSYIQNVASANLEAFWRDLALIGALILTYTQTLPRAASRRSALRWTPRARRVAPRQVVVPRRVVTVVQTERAARTAAKAPVVRLAASNPIETPIAENIFRDDPAFALAS